MMTKLAWRKSFPRLAGISKAVAATFDSRARTMRASQGARLCGPEHLMSDLILPVSGAIRVGPVAGGTGGTILHSAGADESRAMTTACQLLLGPRPVEVIAHTDVELVLLPRDAFDELMAASAEFRGYLVASLAKRITGFLVALEETLASGIDGLLAAKLVEPGHRAHADLTLDALSVALGTPPEVISQHLAAFESRGWVALRQGWLDLTDVPALRRLAGRNIPTEADFSTRQGTRAVRKQSEEHNHERERWKD